ncbi:putative MFS transporter [Xylariales sp. AK1849]|nr:putative MFS transporter [Xylariales sp. AK1849]
MLSFLFWKSTSSSTAHHNSFDRLVEPLALSAANHQLRESKSTQQSNTCEHDTSAGRDASAQPSSLPPAPYSIFTRKQKKWTIVIAAWAGWFSTASSFIYFPAIPFMAEDMGVSVQDINFTVTSYLIASGVFPTITGNAADRYGRRSVLIASLAIYAAANIGLATQRSFVALLVLRMVQSAAISGGFPITYGVLGDLTTPHERGGYTGAISIFLNTPPSIAPMISGLLLIRWTWPSIFWFLSIASPIVLVAMVLFLPETCRALVGNGSRRCNSCISTPVVPILCPRGDQLDGSQQDEANEPPSLPNPLSVLALLKNRTTLSAVLCYGIYYTVHSCLQASLSTIFVEVYQVSGLVAGLVYIPFGAACSIASFVAGIIIDRDYRVTAKAQGITIDRVRGDDLTAFPIERARLRTHKYFVIICASLIAAYGWVLQVKAHMAVPLVLQLLIGFSNQVLYTSLNTLLIDYRPDQSASAQAVNNLVRCEPAAAGLAVLGIMLGRLGSGWCFVIFAALHCATFPMLCLLERRGLRWRQAKHS